MPNNNQMHALLSRDVEHDNQEEPRRLPNLLEKLEKLRPTLLFFSCVAELVS